MYLETYVSFCIVNHRTVKLATGIESQSFSSGLLTGMKSFYLIPVHVAPTIYKEWMERHLFSFTEHKDYLF